VFSSNGCGTHVQYASLFLTGIERTCSIGADHAQNITDKSRHGSDQPIDVVRYGRWLRRDGMLAAIAVGIGTPDAAI
jgi:hypothetical protein